MSREMAGGGKSSMCVRSQHRLMEVRKEKARSLAAKSAEAQGKGAGFTVMAQPRISVATSLIESIRASCNSQRASSQREPVGSESRSAERIQHRRNAAKGRERNELLPQHSMVSDDRHCFRTRKPAFPCGVAMLRTHQLGEIDPSVSLPARQRLDRLLRDHALVGRAAQPLSPHHRPSLVLSG